MIILYIINVNTHKKLEFGEPCFAEHMRDWLKNNLATSAFF